jgi:hypothetical protein
MTRSVPWAQEHAITSDEALMLEHMPGNSIVIVGAGYISVEFASIFRGFGADVHLMFRKPLPLTGRAPRLLPQRGLLVHAAHLCRKHPSPGCLPACVPLAAAAAAERWDALCASARPCVMA